MPVASKETQLYRAEYQGANEVTYVITFQLKPSKEQDFLALLQPVLQSMRHEDSFRNAVLHRDPSNASRYMLYETWQDADDVVTVQIHRPYRKEFWDALPDLLDGERDIQTWVPLQGDFALD